MKKSDLQNFDIVETRVGGAYMVNADNGLIFGRWGWMPLSDYEENLTNADGHEGARYYDIVRVRRPEQGDQYGLRSRGDAPIIWERKEKPKLSTFERSFLEKTGMKYMARNKNGNLAFFENEPFKDHSSNAWTPCGGASGKLKDAILGELFSFITWEDSEPWSVSELLEVEG